MLVFTIFITSLFLILLCLSITFEWKDMAGINELIVTILITILIFIVIIFWFVIGFMRTETAHGKIVPKEKYEILIGEDKIIITNLYNKKITETIEDAARYNTIIHNKDKYYIEITEYDMYGDKIKTTIDIKDLRFIGK